MKAELFCETSSVFELGNLTTSKTQQFCEISSIFELDNVKDKAILRDFLIFLSWQMLTTSKTKQFRETSFKNAKLSAELTASYQCVFVFSIPPATKKWSQVIRSAAPVTQNHLSKPEDLMLQNATPRKKSSPWTPNISDDHVSCTAPATRDASFQILFKCLVAHACHRSWKCCKTRRFCSLLATCRIPCACHAERHLNVKKCSEPVSFFYPPCIALYEVDILRAYKVGVRSPLYTPTMGDKAVFCARNMPLDLEDDFIQRWLSSLYPSGFPQGSDSIYAAMYFTDRWFPSNNGHNMSHRPL